MKYEYTNYAERSDMNSAVRKIEERLARMNQEFSFGYTLVGKSARRIPRAGKSSSRQIPGIGSS